MTINSSQSNRIICWNCGFEDEGNFCSQCGSPLHPRSERALLEYIKTLIPTTVFLTWWSILTRTPSFFNEVVQGKVSSKSRPVPFYIVCSGVLVFLRFIIGVPDMDVTWADAYRHLHPDQQKEFRQALGLTPDEEKIFAWSILNERFNAPGGSIVSKKILKTGADSVRATDVADWVRSRGYKKLAAAMNEATDWEGKEFRIDKVPGWNSLVLAFFVLLQMRLMHTFLGTRKRTVRETMNVLLYLTGFWLPISAIHAGLNIHLWPEFIPEPQVYALRSILLLTLLFFYIWHNYIVLKQTHGVGFLRWGFALGLSSFLVWALVVVGVALVVSMKPG